MAQFIELHVYQSGDPILVNVDAISQIGKGRITPRDPDISGCHVIRLDGGMVDVQEDYVLVKMKLESRTETGQP